MARYIIGIVILLHGLAHASLASWASDGPMWITTPLWFLAMIGYLAAGFGILGLRALRMDWVAALIVATGASITLVALFGDPKLPPVILIDLAVGAVAFIWHARGRVHWASTRQNL
jgi:peptidoglycan/LPS O-acetylase OafA/YrhL